MGEDAPRRETLQAEGIQNVAEPCAHDQFDDDINPIGRVPRGASTVICTPPFVAQGLASHWGRRRAHARLRGVT